MVKNKIKTLVILTPGFPMNEADSTCLPPQQLFVKALKTVNPDLNIVVLTFQYPFFSGEYLWHRIKVIAFGNLRNDRLSRLFTRKRVSMYFERLQDEYQIVGLLSFWLGKCALIGNELGLRYKIPHYNWLLGQDAKVGNKYFNKIKPLASSLIAISDFVANKLEDNYGVKPMHVIPVGVEVNLFLNQIAEKDIDILGAGSLIALKQYPVFLEMISSLKNDFPKICAVICGDGPEIDTLKAMVDALGITNNISLLGELPHSEVLGLMRRSKIFLHPSIYEGFSTVCLEALNAGNRVVSFIQPMNFDIKNWYIAADIKEMEQQLHHILQMRTITTEPVLPFNIHDSARAMLKLYGQSDAAIDEIRPAMALNER